MAMEKENFSTPSVLSKEDIGRLLADRSTRAQMDVVEKLTEQYASQGKDALSTQQIAIANDIFHILLTRGEAMVRAMLAMNLSQINTLPPELVRQMATDANNDVAGPVLQYSHALSDHDLVGIIDSLVDTEKLMAIAKRDTVSDAVSDVLVNTSIDSVVSTLVQNEGATITDQTFEKIAQHHSDNAEVMECIFQRNAVPVAVVEKIIAHLSDTMRQNLEKKYGNLGEIKVMKSALDQSLEVASLKMMGFTSSDKELMRVLHHLDETHKLSPFSALSMGNLQLFEVSLSRLLRIPHKNVHLLLQDATGFKTAYERAELPETLFEATALAVRAIRELEAESQKKGGYKEFSSGSQVLERMRKLSAGKDVKGADRFYAMMQHCLH